MNKPLIKKALLAIICCQSLVIASAQEQHWLVGDDFLYTSYDAKVGVNTNDPQYELDVNGQVNAKKLIVNGEEIQNHWTREGNNLFVTTGNVGIGTATPTEKLTVKGNVHVATLLVDPQVAGPDYVFDSDYKLPSLEWLRGYINENGHLPYFKSAEVMEKEGIDLEETQMALLRTLEEAVLHQIGLQKRMEKLIAEHELLKSELAELTK